MGSGDFPPFPLYLDALRSPQESEGEFLSPWSLCFWRSQNDATQLSWPEILSAGLEHSTKHSPMCPQPRDSTSHRFVALDYLTDRQTNGCLPIYPLVIDFQFIEHCHTSALFEGLQHPCCTNETTLRPQPLCWTSVLPAPSKRPRSRHNSDWTSANQLLIFTMRKNVYIWTYRAFFESCPPKKSEGSYF